MKCAIKAAAVKNKEAESENLDYIAHRPILALALAQTLMARFPARHQAWYNAIFEIQQKFQETVPELKPIKFVKDAESGQPESWQVLELITILKFRGLIENYPGGQHMNTALLMNRKMKRKIKDELGERLCRYKKQIDQMSDIFSKHFRY